MIKTMVDDTSFRRIYANLPVKARDEVIVVIDGEPYSWRNVRLELENKTELGQKMLEKMKKMEII